MYEKQSFIFLPSVIKKDGKIKTTLDQGWVAPTMKAIFGNQCSPTLTVHPLDHLEVRLPLFMPQLTEKQKESSIKEALKVITFAINTTLKSNRNYMTHFI